MSVSVGLAGCRILRPRYLGEHLEITATEAEQRLEQPLTRLPSPLPKDRLRNLFVTVAPDAVCRQVQEHLDVGLDGLIFSFPHGTSPEEVTFTGRTLSSVLPR